MIKFENVSFSYPNGFKAVDNLSFEIEKGENIAIIGQNGAGKTTTVKMINGLLRPVSGSVFVDDKNTKDHTTAQLSRTAGYVFQNPDDQIFNDTVRKEIEFGPKIIGQNDKEIEGNTQWAAGLCGLFNHLEDNPYDLPLSIRKFVTIASVLAMRSKIVILDEPTAGQDLNGLLLLENILKELKKEQITIITITHDMEFVIENFNKIIVMSQKQILKVGNPHEVFSDNSLLQRSMLKKSFIKNLVDNLEMNPNIFDETEFVTSMLEKSKVVSVE